MSLVFLRAPMHDTREEVCRWLLDRNCYRIEVYQGPDMSWRGSGVVRPMSDEECTAIAERAGIL